MRKSTEELRSKILKGAEKVLYEKGYQQMSFSLISQAASVPRGNLNYHFKTKEEIVMAIIDARKSRSIEMLNGWAQEFDSPHDRLIRFTKMSLHDRKKVARYGCPMGTLSNELGKYAPKLGKYARSHFEIFRKWLVGEFTNYCSGDPETLAAQMLISVQGASLLAHVYDDPSTIDGNFEAICAWLLTLESK